MLMSHISKYGRFMGVILAGEPFSQEKTQEIVDQFFHDGFVHIPNVLTTAEVKALINKTDEIMDDPEFNGF